MKRTNLLLLLLLCPLSGFAQFNFPVQGKVEIDSMTSKVLGKNRQYSVYLPKSYATNSDRKYPILYLLHGLYDNNKGWVMRGHLQDVANKVIDSGEACEMLIVVPDAGTFYNGYFNMEDWPYETFFFSEFLPYIESKYRVIGDKQHRAIAGLSMGGGGATAYAQKHSDKFSSSYAMSALMDLPNAGAVQAQDKKMGELNRTVSENSCVNFVVSADEPTRVKLQSVRWFVDCGDDDFLFDVNIAYCQEMRKANIPYQLRVRDGAHDWEYWHSALYNALSFVSDGFLKL
jgi:Predicted esterase